MKKELLKMYRKCRAAKPFMLVGRDAECSLNSARTILRFRELEADGLVRMRCEPETENYFDVYGAEENPKYQKQMEEAIERFGLWWTCSEWWDGEEWRIADSCGMHTGYQNPLDPFENCYVIGEMKEAIDALENHQSTELQTQLAICYP